MANQTEFNRITTIFSRLASVAGRIARFSYTDTAYNNRQIEGVAQYDFNREQNIPLATETSTNPVILNKGIRAQGASIARDFQNHFTGRVSFNLNMVVDMLLSFLVGFNSFIRSNANEYDPTATYLPGDKAYIVSFAGDQALHTWYRRRNFVDPAGSTGVPPTDQSRWELLRETTSLAKELEPSTVLRTIRRTGLYSASTAAIFGTALDGPAVTAQPFSLRVYGDVAHVTMTVQEIFYKNTGIEFTRVLENGIVVIDWYKSKDPVGLNIIGVNGSWAFRVEANGHLMLYYGPDDAAPNVWVDRSIGSPTFGHLIWQFKD